ncbi:bifunctional histidinol-phosphatase/imidazoleglycerol-phosphate dehydratase HisB [Pinirhizobacter sp.]|jgi:imidazoleglycerol-phosphate dehydratase/histidinol-phosphatase|uniref:bifunctional histidinol-phosphatase/imidazoleglycerol-phosphate dehydratase HisB n=1 Tax=Pinirhizobacter sp. TaxID=2950432 RepID=UPI002F41F0FD
MSGKVLFLGRDGCIIARRSEGPVDAYDKLALAPGVIAALQRFVSAGFDLVMVTHQPGLGGPGFPREGFEGAQALLLGLLASQGIVFRDVFIDESLPGDDATMRSPGTGMLHGYLADDSWSRVRSAMVGDCEADMHFAANMGVRGMRIGQDGLDWPAIAHAVLDRPRTANVVRRTKETNIRVSVDLDRVAEPHAHTGLGFFDHMLEQIGKHGGFALTINCDGDTHIDEHHTIEDCALALGQALRQALGDKRGIGRYGFTLPMDESAASAALDLSGRPYFVFEGSFPRERVGEVPTELVPHFFRSLCETLGANLHLTVHGDNAHHMVEACFKVVARTLRQALRREGAELPSTKGAL